MQSAVDCIKLKLLLQHLEVLQKSLFLLAVVAVDETMCSAGRRPGGHTAGLQREAIDHFIVFGENHFDYLISEFVDYYHRERPHQRGDTDH